MVRMVDNMPMRSNGGEEGAFQPPGVAHSTINEHVECIWGP